MSRMALVAVSFAALAAVGCRGSQSKLDAAGTVGTDGSGAAGSGGPAGSSGTGGTGGATGAGGGAAGAAGGSCNATNHSFAATPVGDSASCTFQLPPPDNGQSQFIVRPDDGGSLARDTTHQNGWDYTDGIQRTIQIFGPTCNAITAATVHTICIEFQFTSDREAKRDFSLVDRDAILDRLSRLPITSWRYKEDAKGARHIGPMAQDFKLTFDVGSTDRTIYPLDESGVAFAAIQALNEKVERLAKENARLRKQMETLSKRSRVGR